MKEFLLENWQLVLTSALALINAAITFFVHRLSTVRIGKTKEEVADALQQVVALNQELIERINK